MFNMVLRQENVIINYNVKMIYITLVAGTITVLYNCHRYILQFKSCTISFFCILAEQIVLSASKEEAQFTLTEKDSIGVAF